MKKNAWRIICSALLLLTVSLAGCVSLSGEMEEALKREERQGGNIWDGTNWMGHVLVSDEDHDYAVFYNDNFIGIYFVFFKEYGGWEPRVEFIAGAECFNDGNELLITGPLLYSYA
jgi:hypothetical protein